MDDNTTEVIHTYDWTHLTDESRFARARAYTEAALLNSVNRLSLKVENKIVQVTSHGVFCATMC